MNRMMAVMVLLGLGSADAHAIDWWKWSAGGALELDARAMQREDETAAAGLSETVTAGLGLRGFGGRTLGIMAGVDARFGGGLQGGFAYDGGLLPLGVGLRLGGFGLLGVLAGVNLSGVTGHVPFAVEYPIEARLELDLGRRVHLSGFGRASFITVADARQNGAEHAPFGDELRAGVTLRVGRGGQRHQESWGNGIYVGALYGESLGTRELGLVIGYGITSTFVGR
ncbi:MAG TPA: hypothetical protein VML75_08465 [Kofleriaceae bacterium]|nr:hypothetical protein [Kofleriaceae bacterium]